MPKSASELMQEILFSAVVAAIVALKDSSKGLPNQLLRDLQTVHANTAFADLPQPVQATVAESARGAFSKLLKEGYGIAPAAEVRAQRPRPDRPGGPPAPRGDRPKRSGPPEVERRERRTPKGPPPPRRRP